MIGSSKLFPAHTFAIKYYEHGSLLLVISPYQRVILSYDGQLFTRQNGSYLLLPEVKDMQISIEGIVDFKLVPAQHVLNYEQHELRRDAFVEDSLAGTEDYVPRDNVDPKHKLELGSAPVYVEFEQLGSGGQGDVHRVVDARNGDVFAAKTLKEGDENLEEAKAAFEAQATLLKGLTHVSVIHPVFASLADQRQEHVVDHIGGIYENGKRRLIMEYLSGHDLCVQRKEDPFSVLEVSTIFKQCTEALTYLHENGISHRYAGTVIWIKG